MKTTLYGLTESIKMGVHTCYRIWQNDWNQSLEVVLAIANLSFADNFIEHIQLGTRCVPN
jgi:hypothetical protein